MRGAVRKVVAILLCAAPWGCSGTSGTAQQMGAGTSSGGTSVAGSNTGGVSGSTGLGSAGLTGTTAGAGGSAQQSGAGGLAGDASGLSGAGGQVTQTQPMCGPGCFPLCQGGMCQCECSPMVNCDSPGWQLHTIGWDKFAHPDLTGGVELCMPEEWTPTETGGATFSNGQFSFNVYAEVRLDHADALQRLSDTDAAHCTAQDYEFTLARAGALPAEQWPALIQTYREMPPACGACPNFVPATELNLVANVSIAYGEYMLTTYASVPESMADAGAVIAIGRTARTQTTLTPSEAGAEIGDLIAQHAEQCP